MKFFKPKTKPVKLTDYSVGMDSLELKIWTLLWHVTYAQPRGMVANVPDRYRGMRKLQQHHFQAQFDIKHPQKVRATIRKLRVDYGCPILSDRGGYWVTDSKEEAMEYVRAMEKVSKAKAKALFETYKAVADNFGISNKYLEKQMEIFPDL